MQCTEEHIETAAEGQDSECSTEEKFCPFDDELADPTINCKHVSMGRYKIATGPHKGHLKMKQSRCKYCKERMKINKEKRRAPPTCFECSFHSVAVCKKFYCWQRHLAAVRRVQEEEFVI